MRLVKVEIRRLFSRRAVVVLMVLGAFIAGAITFGVLYDHRPVSDADRAEAVATAEQYNSEPWVVNGIERCERRGGTTQICEQRFQTDPDDLLYREELELTNFKDWVIPTAGVLAVLMLLVGSTFVGADYSSGSIGTQLVFEPRRTRVWSAKTAGLAIGVGVFGGLALLASNAAMLAFVRIWDRPVPEGIIGDWAAATGRGVLLIIAAAIGGYALTVLSRHTAAALGLIAAYGIAGEAVARAVWSGSERWLLSNHLVAWVGGDWSLERFDNCFEGPCTPEVIEFTAVGAGTYLGVLAVIASLVSWAVFRRRDVA